MSLNYLKVLKMDTNLGSTIIGAIIIIILALPFIMSSRNKKETQKKMLQSLSGVSAKNNCQIDQHEILGSFAIGIDETKNFAFFYHLSAGKEIEQSINLSEVKNCKVINTSRTLQEKGGNRKVIDKLELSFMPTANNKPEVKLEFFNSEESLQQNGVLQSIEKWSKLINSRLN
jgi:hypothetical protein